MEIESGFEVILKVSLLEALTIKKIIGKLSEYDRMCMGLNRYENSCAAKMYEILDKNLSIKDTLKTGRV